MVPSAGPQTGLSSCMCSLSLAQEKDLLTAALYGTLFPPVMKEPSAAKPHCVRE